MLPLGIAYAVSAGIWLLQSPPWLRPIAAPGIAATIAAWLLAWLLTSCIMALRLRAPRPVQSARPHTMTAHVHRPPRWPTLFLWRQLFWLPFWRNDNLIGVQQSVLLAGALASMLAWLLRVPLVPAPLLGLLASASLIIVTDRGDKAVREQIAVLRPSLDAWPLASAALLRLACAASLLPAFAVLLGAALLLYCHRPWRPAAARDQCVRHHRQRGRAGHRRPEPPDGARARGAGRPVHPCLERHRKRIMELNLSSPVLHVEQLDFHFATHSVFQRRNLQFGPGITWLRGANGAGKTTLLKLAGGALLPARGVIRLDELDSAGMPLAYRAQAFYCGGDAPALPWLQVHEWLDLHLALYPGSDQALLNAELDAFAMSVDLAAKRHRAVAGPA